MTTTDRQPDGEVQIIHLSADEPIHVFPFVTLFHCEVVMRRHDDASQDIKMTPDEADHVANVLKIAAAVARRKRQNA